MDYRFKRGEPTRDSFRRIAAELCSGIHTDLGIDGVPDVHEARKRTKMLRALLRLTGSGLKKRFRKDADRRLHDIADRLTAPREAAVRLQTLETLLARPGVNAGRFTAVRRRLAADARRKQRELSPAALRELLEEVDEVRDSLLGVAFGARGWSLFEPGLRHAYALGRAGCAAASQSPDPETLHEWRRHAKYLWYHARLLQPIRPKKLTHLVSQLDQLGELLGDNHDLALLDEHLRGIRPALGPTLSALIAQRRAELFTDAEKLGAELYREKPRAFTRRLGKWWRARSG